MGGVVGAINCKRQGRLSSLGMGEELRLCSNGRVDDDKFLACE